MHINFFWGPQKWGLYLVAGGAALTSFRVCDALYQKRSVLSQKYCDENGVRLFESTMVRVGHYPPHVAVDVRSRSHLLGRPS